MAKKRAASSKLAARNNVALRERAITEYHEFLATDKTLAPRVFEKLRDGMRKNRRGAASALLGTVAV